MSKIQVDYDKLFSALVDMKTLCEETDNCEKCPFGNYDYCFLSEETPENWNICSPQIKLLR